MAPIRVTCLRSFLSIKFVCFSIIQFQLLNLPIFSQFQSIFLKVCKFMPDIALFYTNGPASHTPLSAEPDSPASNVIISSCVLETSPIEQVLWRRIWPPYRANERLLLQLGQPNRYWLRMAYPSAWRRHAATEATLQNRHKLLHFTIFPASAHPDCIDDSLQRRVQLAETYAVV